MRSRFLAVLVVCLAAVPLFAQSNEVGLWAAASRVGSTPSGGATVKFDDGRGGAVSWDHAWSRHISTELAALQVKGKGELRFSGDTALGLGDLNMKGATAVVRWHFLPGALLDPYVGGGVAYLKVSDLSSSDLDYAGVPPVDIESKTSSTANVGVNVNLTPSFGLGVDLKYIRYEPNSGTASDEPVKLRLKPKVLFVGARLRF